MANVEMICLVFTDLVGSTALSSQVGPTAAERLRQEHFGLLRAAVAESDGREIKNLGDGLMVAFDSAAAAVNCAVGMQQRLEQRNRRSDQLLSVRIGVALGDADHEGEDYFGPPVVEASRLCAKAQGGQILCGEMVRMMAGGRGDHSFDGVGELELKGLPEPVRAFEVVWEPLGAAAAVPLPPLLRGLPPVGYVGRLRERELLRGLLERVAEGGCRLALISGEPGIGKTRLATLAALEAHGDGANVLYGRCEEELVVPYGPWVEALRHCVLESYDEALRVHVERHGGELCRLLPELARRIPGLPAPTQTDPESERYLLFGAVDGLMAQLAERERLVVVLDDLHWADKGSLLLLRHLVGQGDLERVLLLATYRASDITRRHPLSDALADLRRVDGVERIDLTGLEQEDVIELMQAAAGHELDDDGVALAGEIVRETDGNPFFVAEILRHLNESGAIALGEDGRWHLVGSLEELGLPESVREVVGRRIEGLDPDAGRVLRAAAVIGQEFDLELLARVLERPEEELLDLLEVAVEAAVISESAQTAGRFGFAHALINHTLYEDLGQTRRARLHRRVAEELERLCGEDPGDRIAELARQWGLATQAADSAKAIDYARRAGERALARLAPDDALRWFSQAIELLDSQPEADEGVRCELLIGIGMAQKDLGDPAFREMLLQAAAIARQLGDAQRLVRPTLENTRGWFASAGQVDAERVRGLEAAIDAVEPTSPDRSVLLAILAAELTFSGDAERISGLVDEALASARSLGDRRRLAQVLYHASLALLSSAEGVQLRWELAQEFAPIADELADPFLRWAADHVVASAAIELGKLSEMDSALAQMAEIADRLGQPALRWTTGYYECARHQCSGELDQAEAAAVRAAGLGYETGQTDAALFAGFQLFVIRYEQGRLAELVEVIEQRVAENPGLPALQATMAITYSELGRLDEAQTILEQATADEFAALPYDYLWLNGIARYAEVAARVGATGPATVLYDKLLPFRDHIVTSLVTVSGSAERVLGVLAATLERWDTAEGHFAAADDVHQRVGARLFLARTWMNWGDALLTKGDTADADRARELIARALDLARDLGGGAVVRDAEALLAQLRA